MPSVGDTVRFFPDEAAAQRLLDAGTTAAAGVEFDATVLRVWSDTVVTLEVANSNVAFSRIAQSSDPGAVPRWDLP